jgi:DNA-binding NarL/FixJ family response regulator
MKGQSLAAIGTSLKVSRATVATLASYCYKKFGVSGRQQLAAVVMGGQSSK